jgi:hypothetical protein
MHAGDQRDKRREQAFVPGFGDPFALLYRRIRSLAHEFVDGERGEEQAGDTKEGHAIVDRGWGALRLLTRPKSFSIQDRCYCDPGNVSSRIREVELAQMARPSAIGTGAAPPALSSGIG